MGAAAAAGRGQPACFCLGCAGRAAGGGRVGGGSPRGRWSELPVCSAVEPARAALSCVASACLQKQPLSVPRASPAFFVGVRRVVVVLRNTSARERFPLLVSYRPLASSLIHRSVFLAGSEPDCTRIAARGVIVLGHQSSCTAIHHRSTASNASPAPPPAAPAWSRPAPP